jgi:hypothetical protein
MDRAWFVSLPHQPRNVGHESNSALSTFHEASLIAVSKELAFRNDGSQGRGIQQLDELARTKISLCWVLLERWIRIVLRVFAQYIHDPRDSCCLVRWRSDDLIVRTAFSQVACDGRAGFIAANMPWSCFVRIFHPPAIDRAARVHGVAIATPW